MTKLRKRTLVLLLAGMLAALGGALVFRSSPAGAAELSKEIALREEYLLGEEFLIPEADIVEGGKTYAAEAALRFPDGSLYAGERILLSQKGKYILEYRATEKGLSVKREFTVAENLFSLSGKKSTAVEGTVPHAEGRPGVVATLAQGEKLLLNRRIDLTDKTAKDPLSELFIAPSVQGEADALNLVMVLTDAFDPDNYVTVTAKRLDRSKLNAAWSERSSYYTANAVGQLPVGLEPNATGEFVYEGSSYLMHRNDIYGAPGVFSMAGVPNLSNDCSDLGAPEDIAAQSLILSADYASRRIYLNGKLIADLDDVSMFPTVQWKGFTTGQCYLTVYATNYLKETCTFVLTELDGEREWKGLVKDDDVPEISLVYDGYEEGFPNAVVGRPYPIPAANGYDKTERDLPVRTKVYFDYGLASSINVQVENGAFLPKRAGTYTVVYSATDSFGNRGEFLLEIAADRSDIPLTLSLGSHETAGKTGESVLFPKATVSGNRGRANVEVIARHESSGTEEVLPMQENGYAFRPMYAGEWQIVYRYSDYLETKEESFAFTVEAGARPYIGEEAVLPRYLIRGATYRVPQLFGYEFTTGGPVLKEAQLYLSDDGKAEQRLDGGRITSYADETATVIYRLGSGADSFEKRYDVPVVDVGYDKSTLRIEDYFFGENFTSEAANDRVTLTATAQGTQSFEFADPLQVFDFRIVFGVTPSKNRYDRINFYLEDSSDPSISLKISYIRKGAKDTTFLVNDGEKSYSSTGDFTADSDSFHLFYRDGERTVSPSADYTVPVETNLKGEPFQGFPSKKIYLRVELGNITGSAAVDLLTFNNQPLSAVGYDLIRPEISLNTVQGERGIGEEIFIAPTYAADVLDPDIRFTMKVTRPDGTVAFATDGTVLDSSADPTLGYTVLTDLYGRYTVEYECRDLNDNRTVYSYVFTVVDRTPPTVTLKEGTTSARVGDTVILREVVAEDNYSTCSVLVAVRLPDGRFLDIPGNSFVATEAGVYTVTYLVYDEAGALTTVQYTVTVE